MAFFGNVCNFMLRTNINVAIVDMVAIEVEMPSISNASLAMSSSLGQECPFPDSFFGHSSSGVKIKLTEQAKKLSKTQIKQSENVHFCHRKRQ